MVFWRYIGNHSIGKCLRYSKEMMITVLRLSVLCIGIWLCIDISVQCGSMDVLLRVSIQIILRSVWCDASDAYDTNLGTLGFRPGSVLVVTCRCAAPAGAARAASGRSVSPARTAAATLRTRTQGYTLQSSELDSESSPNLIRIRPKSAPNPNSIRIQLSSKNARKFVMKELWSNWRPYHLTHWRNVPAVGSLVTEITAVC